MSHAQKKVLVTGGAGFVGSHLTDALLAQDHQVTVLDNFSTGKKFFLKPHTGLHIIEGDVRDLSVVKQAANSIDVIVHLAAIASVQTSVETPEVTHAVNVGGTLNVLEAARLQKIKRVLFASSAAVYGDTPNLPVDEKTIPHPLTPYAMDKLECENHLDVYRRQHGIETAAFRFFNIFGPRQNPASSYSGVMSIFAARILENKPLIVYGDGEQTRDFIYVKDAVSILVQAITKNSICTDTINVGNGKSITLNELINLMGQVSKKEITVQYKPVRNGDIRHSCADVAFLKQYYQIKKTSIADGLTRLFASLPTA